MLACEQTVPRLAMWCVMPEKLSAFLSPTSTRSTARAEFLELWALRKLVAELLEGDMLDDVDLWRRRIRHPGRPDLPPPPCRVSCKSVGCASSLTLARSANCWLTFIERPMGVRTRNSKRSDVGEESLRCFMSLPRDRAATGSSLSRRPRHQVLDKVLQVRSSGCY
jgi:hypothetical protein